MAAPESDEEPDYMSEDFLKQCVSQDIRPSLLHSRADKRKHDLLKRHQELNITKEEREKKRMKSVEDAMKVPISEDNKGFQMLQKMGYKPGSSIGANQPSRKKGITEPISINLKAGRSGLGKESHDLEKFEQSCKRGNPEEYRSRQRATVLLKETLADLRKAQFACRNLDEETGKLKPSEVWFWPVENSKKQPSTSPQDDLVDDKSGEEECDSTTKKYASDSEESQESDNEEEDNVPPDLKLSEIATYLREEYLFCTWCGNKFHSKADLDESCPGKNKDDH